MDFALYALVIVGVIAAIKLLMYGMAVKYLLGIRLKEGDCELREPAEMPEHMRELLTGNEGRLAKLGFEFSHCQLCDGVVVTTQSKKWNMVYFNPTAQCYANASVASEPDQHTPVKFELLSFFNDGEKLMTVNGLAHAMIGEIPHVKLQDFYVESLEKQVQAHITELMKLKPFKTPVAVTPEEYAANDKKTMNDQLQSLEQDGSISKTDEGYYRLTVRAALRCGYKQLAGMRKKKAMQAKIRQLAKNQPMPTVELPVEAEAEAYLQTQELMKSKKTGYWGKIAVFLVSMLLFILAFKISFSMNTVMIFLAAIFVHEFGHYLGMRLFKYKDVQVLFLPFIGGATLGEERKASVLQRVVVYLLGPGPGLIIGTVCIYLSGIYHQEYLREFGIFVLVLNYINLLPIMPLDGGRIFELVLFSRISFLKSAFLILSTIILTIAALKMGEPVLLIISLSLLLGLPHQIRQNRGLTQLNKKIKAENLEIEDEVLVPVIFNMFKERPFNKLTFAVKTQMAKYLLNNALKRPPSAGVTILSLFLYAMVLVSPIFVGAGMVLWQTGISRNYEQGVISYYPAPDADKIFVVGTRSMLFKKYYYILDQNGRLASYLGKGDAYPPADLIWRPGKQYNFVLYEEAIKKKRDDESRRQGQLILYNLETHEKKPIKGAETDDGLVDYQKWSADGDYLLGVKSDKAGIITSVVRQNVNTAETDEIEITDANGKKTWNPSFIADNRILLREIEQEETEKQTYRILDLNSREKEDHELPAGTIQWEMTPDGKSLIILKKLFAENTVNHQITTMSLETGEEKILMAEASLPHYSFEDAAKGKNITVSIEVSPAGQWILCTAQTSQVQTVSWLINVIDGRYGKFQEYDMNKEYIDVTYCRDESRICADFSPFYDEEEEEEEEEATPAQANEDKQEKAGGDRIEVYDLSGDNPKKIWCSEYDGQIYGCKFLGNDRILYVKPSNDKTWWKNSNELWELNITNGTNQKFYQPKQSNLLEEEKTGK